MISIGGAIVGVVGVGTILATLYIWHAGGVPIHDLRIYALTGERLNDGGRVYDLRPSDYFPPGEDRRFPLFGPPTIALPWRLLELLPGASGSILWLMLVTIAGLSALLYVTIGTRGWAGLVVTQLGLSIVVVLGVGNVDNLVVAAILWAWAARDRARTLGLILGAITMVKLTPAVLLIWLIGTRRWGALVWATGAMVGLAMLTVLGTEPGIWARYASVMVELAGLGRPVALAFVVAGGVLVLMLGRRWEGFAFTIAVVLMPLGSPQAGTHSWAMLIGAFAPLVEFVRRWPASPRRRDPELAPAPGPRGPSHSLDRRDRRGA